MSLPREYLEQLAASYRSRGYSVEIGGSKGDGLLTLTPDLLASRGDELRFVEVKFPGREDGPSRIPGFEQLFERHPTWHHDIVVSAAPLTGLAVEEIERRLDHVEKLEAAGEHDAAVLLAWAGFEAAARHFLAVRGVATGTPTPSGLLQLLAREGFIDAATSDDLRAAATARNRVAHGFTSGVEPSHASKLRGATAQLLADLRSAA